MPGVVSLWVQDMKCLNQADTCHQDNLIDDPVVTSPTCPTVSDDTRRKANRETLAAIRSHLIAAYKPYPVQSDLNSKLDDIPHLTTSDRSTFRLFALLIPRLVPIEPFLELCLGYETDMKFIPPTVSTHHASGPSFPQIPSCSIRERLRDSSFDLEDHLPIKTTEDLMRYADDVAGSIASSICYLAWSVLTTSSSSRPVDDLACSTSVRPNKSVYRPLCPPDRLRIVEKAREMGRGLQLVNIARDVAKDAAIGRLYVPLSAFPNGSSLLDVLIPSSCLSPSYAPYTLPLLDTADELRTSSTSAMDDLPPAARAGTRAMVASYFEIAKEIRRRSGEVDENGVKVKRQRRALAAARAFWGLS